ncbi:MAG: phosphotransferase [Gemmatimonadota bacterium]|nr:MAG: phosphotransferase [Gemmatimonadota bacterium]
MLTVPDVVRLACPRCRAEVVWRMGQDLECAGCAARFPVSDDVLAIGDPGRGHFDRVGESLHGIFARAREVGCVRALSDVGAFVKDELTPEYKESLSDERKGMIQVLVPGSRLGRVLVLGLSNGAVPIAFGRWSREVIVCNYDFERCRMAALRAEELGLTNLRWIWLEDLRRLPFLDGDFDCVVLEDALRALRLERSSTDDPHLELLREVRRVLRPDGHIFLSGDNAFGLELFAFSRRNRLGPLGPIFNAFRRWVPWARRRGLKRHHALGRYGYRRLLHRAGFSQASFYCLHPSRTRFQRVSLLERKSALSPASPSGLRVRLTTQLGSTSAFCTAFGVVAAPSSVERSWFMRLVDHIRSQLDRTGRQAFPSLMITGAIGSSGVVATISGDLVLRVPLNPVSTERIARNYAGIERARQSGVRLGSLAPAPVISGEYEGVPFTVEARIHGQPLSWLPRSVRQRAENEAFQLLLSLKSATFAEAKPMSPELSWGESMTKQIERMSAWTVEAGDASALSAILKHAEAVRDSGIPLCLSHGDYSHKNILANDRGELVGIVDWEHWAETRLVTHDFLHFLLGHQAAKNSTSRASALSAWLRGAALEAQSSRWVARFRETWNLPGGWELNAALAYWVAQVVPLVGTAKELDQVWRKRNFTSVLRVFGEVL